MMKNDLKLRRLPPDKPSWPEKKQHDDNNQKINLEESFSLISSGLPSTGRKDDTNNESIKSQCLRKDKDKNHSNKKLRLLCICSNTSIPNDPNSHSSRKASKSTSQTRRKVRITIKKFRPHYSHRRHTYTTLRRPIRRSHTRENKGCSGTEEAEERSSFIAEHFPDGTLCARTDGEDSKSKEEVFKQVKQECISEGHTGLKLGIKKNRNGFWEVSKPEDSSGNRQRENFDNIGHNVIPMSSSATGSDRDGEDPSVNQDGGMNYDFSTKNGIELDSVSLNLDPIYGFTDQNPSAQLGNAEVIVLSDSDEEDEPLISSGPAYKSNGENAGGVTYAVPPQVIPDLYPEDPALGTAGSSCLGLFNTNDDEFGLPLWSLPSGSQGGPGFQLFGSDVDVSDALVDVPHGSINCRTSMNGYTLTSETAMGSAALVPESSLHHCTTDINDELVDNPLAFGGDDPSLQIFLPTRPSDAAVQADMRDQPDVSNGIPTEDWISLRLGDCGSGSHVEPTAVNGLNPRQLLPSKEGALDSLADTASLLLGMNDNRSANLATNDNRPTKTSRERSDSPFTFPRQRRSVRPRLYLSINSDSE